MDKGKTIKSVTFQNINKCQDVVYALILKLLWVPYKKYIFSIKLVFVKPDNLQIKSDRKSTYDLIKSKNKEGKYTKFHIF